MRTIEGGIKASVLFVIFPDTKSENMLCLRPDGNEGSTGCLITTTILGSSTFR